MSEEPCICEIKPVFVKSDLRMWKETCIHVKRDQHVWSLFSLFYRSILQVCFTGLFYRSLLQVSFTGLFYRSLLQVSFTGLFYRSMYDMRLRLLFGASHHSLFSHMHSLFSFHICSLLCEKRPTCVERDLHMWKARVVHDRRLRLWSNTYAGLFFHICRSLSTHIGLFSHKRPA